MGQSKSLPYFYNIQGKRVSFEIDIQGLVRIKHTSEHSCVRDKCKGYPYVLRVVCFSNVFILNLRMAALKGNGSAKISTKGYLKIYFI